MSRPEHPGVPLPSNCIRDLRQRQEEYDEDPCAYEKREAEQKEQRQREEMEERARYEEKWKKGIIDEMKPVTEEDVKKILKLKFKNK